MDVRIECPNCQKKYKIKEEKLPKGKDVAFPCPACKSTIEVRLPTQTEPGTPAAATESSDEQEAQREALKKEILRGLGELPPMPQILMRAREIMENPSSGFAELAAVLETDQAIATRVLKMANSSYYGMSGKVSSIKHASVVLGQKTLGELITMVSASSVLGNTLTGYGLDSGDLWLHSLVVAFASKHLATMKKPELANDAFSAGLIHDSGKLILDPYVTERKDSFEDFMRDGEKTFLSAEKAILGFDHSEIAAEVCKEWQIPESLTGAIRYHHYPGSSGGDELAFIVHVADTVAIMTGIGAGIDGMLYEMDEKALELLGLEGEDLTDLMWQAADYVGKMEIDTDTL